jgi:predicted metal-binding transcription factor (methanogenesis marker protein 9)
MSENSYYKLYITGPESPEKEEIRKEFQEKPTPEVYDVRDLKRTDREQEIIDRSIASTEQAIADLGISCPTIHQDNIHILSPKEFHTKVELDKGGKTAYGHIYLVRKPDQSLFIHELTHELSHLVSFYAFRVKHEYNEESEQTTNIYGMRKGGFAFIPKPEQKDAHFEGLDEAATEMFAQHIRQKFIESNPTLNSDTKEFLQNKIVYWPHVMVIDKVISSITDSEEEYNKTKNDLFREKITGESTVLKKISQHNKEWVKILYEMGSSDEDAKHAAEQLGFFDLVQEIENYATREPSF